MIGRVLVVLAIIASFPGSIEAMELRIVPESNIIDSCTMLAGVVEISNKTPGLQNFVCPAYTKGTLWYRIRSGGGEKVYRSDMVHWHSRTNEVRLNEGESIYVPIMIMKHDREYIFEAEGNYEVKVVARIDYLAGPGKKKLIESPWIKLEVMKAMYVDAWRTTFDGCPDVMLAFWLRRHPSLMKDVYGTKGYKTYLLYQTGGWQTVAANRQRMNIPEAYSNPIREMLKADTPSYQMWAFFDTLEARDVLAYAIGGDYILDQ